MTQQTTLCLSPSSPPARRKLQKWRRKLTSRDQMRTSPSYWWDYKHYDDGRMTVIIETDDPRCGSGVLHEYEDKDIDRAEKAIADLVAGRKPKWSIK